MSSTDNTIKALVQEILKPDRKTGLPGASSTELEDTAWFDFTEVKYLFDPAEQLATPSSPTAGTSEQDLEVQIYLEQLGTPSYDYAQFSSKLRAYIKQAVIDLILSFPYRIITGYNQNRYTTSYDEDTQILTFIPDNDSEQYITTLQTYTFDIRQIVDLMMFVPPFELLADIADIYFSINYPDAATTFFAKQTFFSKIYQFFTSGNGDYATAVSTVDVIRLLNTGNLSMPTAGSTTEEHVLGYWNALNEHLASIYGEGEEDISAILADYEYRAPPASDYSFLPFLHKEVNLGLRLVYRQVWRPMGHQRGEIVRTIPLGPRQSQKISSKILRRTKITRTSESLKATEHSQETSDTTKDSREVVREATSSFNWNISQEVEGGFNAGVWKIGGKTSASIGGDSSSSSRNTSSRLSESMRKMASKISTETRINVSTEAESEFETTTASEISNPNDEIPVTYVYSKLQRRYEVFTSLAEVQNVIMLAEKMPPPDEINLEWVKKHDWIIAKVLLDDSFRDALNSVSQEVRSPDTADFVGQLKKVMDDTVGHLGTLSGNSSSISLRNIDMINQSQENYRRSIQERIEWQRQNYELKAKQNRLFEHIRANILHYCRAIWLQEDPQQRIMRYRKLDLSLPVNWEFHPNDGEPVPIDSLLTMLNDGDDIDGTYRPAPDSVTVPVADLINPAGPISFYANYSVYYMRPEYMQGNIFSMLNFYKSPYLYYASSTSEPELIDPVLKKYRLDYPPANVQDSDIQNNQDEMIDMVPTLRMRYRNAVAARDADTTGTSPDPVQAFLNDLAFFKNYYAEYLYRQEMTRRVLVDTNSLMIDILPGDGSVLETFKLAHRAVDVLKALEEKDKLDLENKRRRKLVNADKLGDPDIERVTVVTNSDKLSDILNLTSAVTADDDNPT